MRESNRIQEVRPPIVPVVERMISATPGTISMAQGMVAFAPPHQAIDALATFHDDPASYRYGPVEGLPSLIEALEEKLINENGIHVRPNSRLVVTAGSNMAFVHALLAIADFGDEIILVTPFYFNHEMAVVMAGCRSVPVAVDEHCQLQLDSIRAALTPRTRAVVTISPNNPTGVVYSQTVLSEVNSLCRERGIYHIHDEAYEYFVYDDATHFSPGSITDAGAHTISMYSFSKAYGFAGWRVGYMVIPKALSGAMDKIQDTVLISPPAASQRAALGALSAGASYCRLHLPALAKARQVLLDELSQLSDLCTVPPATGAMYYLVRIHKTIGALELVTRLIHEHQVAVMPGTTFGITDSCTLRISYGALDYESAREGASRLASGLRAILS